MPRPTSLALLFVLLAACSGGNDEEVQRACQTADRLTAAEDRAALRETLDDLIDASADADDELEEHAQAFRDAIDKDDEAAATAAIGEFYERCERLGVDTLEQ